MTAPVVTSAEGLRDWPGSYWQRGTFLLHQQCWCWGQDIRSPHGNLLQRYGFTRVRAPEGREGSSRYWLRDGSQELYLWGFGVALRDDANGALYLNRYNFMPRWLEDGKRLREAWRIEDLGDLRPPLSMRSLRCTRRMLRVVLRRLADYERWVLAEFGVSYRREVLREWRRPAILPERMPREWDEMSWRVEDPPVTLV